MYGDKIIILILGLLTVFSAIIATNKGIKKGPFKTIFSIITVILFIVTAVFAIMFRIHLLQAWNRIW